MTLHTPERDEAFVAYAETLPVYFAFSEALKLVKIGFSSNVRQRLTTIPTDRQGAGRMVLIGWMLGGPRVEAQMHDRFAVDVDRGEWFRPTPFMADLIDEDGEEGEPPVLSSGEFRVTSRAYWAARRRLAMTAPVERVVHDFGDGRTFRTVELINNLDLPSSLVGQPGIGGAS